MNAIIFHGTDCKPTDYWYGWLKGELEGEGYEVTVPYYAGINRDPLDDLLPDALAKHYDENTVLVGHSAGSPLILSVLERIDVKVKQVILVAGFIDQISDTHAQPVLQESYDWQKIKAHADEFVVINSVDDPWGCDDRQGRRIFDQVGGTQIIRNEGHFGSEHFGQPYATFPLLRALVLEQKS